MRAYPSSSAIIAATHGNSAKNAERRARLDAISGNLSFCVILLLKGRGRPAMPVILRQIDAAFIAAHNAVGA